MEITYGRGGWESGFKVDGEVMADMERRMSREVVGVRIFRRDDSIAARMVVSTPAIISLAYTEIGERWIYFQSCLS